MSARDEYIPSMLIDNTAPPRRCSRCNVVCPGVFYVNAAGKTLCAKCRP